MVSPSLILVPFLLLQSGARSSSPSSFFRHGGSIMLLAAPFHLTLATAEQYPPKSCPADDQPDEGRDPHLEQHPLPPEIAGTTVNGSYMFYIRPDVSTYYHGDRHEESDDGNGVTITAKRPYFNGLAGKFINMSNAAVRFYWSASPSGPHHYMSDCGPFQSTGTATFPTHIFFFADARDQDDVKARFTVKRSRSVYVYDPYDGNLDRAREALTQREYASYHLLHDSNLFAAAYREITGRDYLGLFPLRKRPAHKMWTADYFGQEHWVETKETHVTSLPTNKEELRLLDPTVAVRDGKRTLEEHRNPGKLNLTMTVLSCAPRAFEIRNFLSDVEVDHILYLATGMHMGKSSTSSSSGNTQSYDDKVSVRTSKNTWVRRETSAIVDILYRRAADLLMIDESLLRRRDPKDSAANAATFGSPDSISEHLQLVNYQVGQQYTPHHDFAHPSTTAVHQQQRFATVLLYLNEGMEGGETIFPRWINAETSEALNVVPEKGKAVLFYSTLPDGNPDDLSQHAAQPVTEGEKWLTNLWIWDPASR